MKKLVFLFPLVLSCASATQVPSEYVAAFDVTCFMYSIENAQNKEAAIQLHDKCLAAITKYFRSGVKK